jgi:hypothetical protein
MAIFTNKVQVPIFSPANDYRRFSSGPKRYDYDPEPGAWAYSRDGTSLGQLLEEELSKPFGEPVKLGLEPEKFKPVPPKSGSEPSSPAVPSTESQEAAEKTKSARP